MKNNELLILAKEIKDGTGERKTKLIALKYYLTHGGTYHPNKVVKELKHWSEYFSNSRGQKTCSGHYSLVQVSGRFFKMNDINDIWVSYEV